jgi:hypothetical protein
MPAVAEMLEAGGLPPVPYKWRVEVYVFLSSKTCFN